MKTLSDMLPDLNKLVDFINANPDLPCPFADAYFGVALTREKCQRESLAQYIRAVGKADKEFSSNLFSLRFSFGHIRFSIVSDRDAVCEKRVEKKIVPATIIPATPEKVIPEHEEEVVTWDCHPILAGEPEPQHA